MGICCGKHGKESSYDEIEEDQTDANTSSRHGGTVEITHQESGYHRDSGHHVESGHHGWLGHKPKEEEVIITIGQSTQVHSKVIQDDLLGVVEYPFLSDQDTIEFISNSYTMFIMRGVPGSGKSTLSKRIMKEYPGAVKCSADDYFIGDDGIYRFDLSELSQAHQACQEKARESCERRVPVIIIDNTNIHRWEMSTYLKLAQLEYFYHVIPVEPNTPWKDNVEELHHRTTHGVNQEKIKEMLDNFKSQRFEPLYYGWFLTQQDSENLIELGTRCLREGVEAIGRNLPEASSAADILNGLNTKFVKPPLILHCTAKYISMNPKHEYHRRDIVKRAMHRTFHLRVTGFSYTDTNIGAKIELDPEELELFENEYEDESEPSDKDSRYHGKSLVDFSKQLKIQHGCTAHITLTFSHDSSARITGKDMLEIWTRNQLGNPPWKCSDTNVGRFVSWDDGYFFFELKSPVYYTTLFHGYYPQR